MTRRAGHDSPTLSAAARGSGGEARPISDRRPEEMGRRVRERYCGAYPAFDLLNQLNDSSPAAVDLVVANYKEGKNDSKN